MKTITFTCELITPMFMAGADGRTPELRPSEFKGMMRFWWRAIRAEDDIKKLKAAEAKIFGGTEEKEGKSKVKVTLTGHIPPQNFIGEDVKNEITNDYGCKYLLYSTFALRERGEPIIRKYIKTGYRFDITIQSIDENTYKHALSSFWLSIYLGGFGTRARRGGGNIAVQSGEGDTWELDFIPKVSNEEQLGDWIDKNLKKIKSIIQSGTTTKYSNLSGGRILVLKPKNKWIDALSFIGNLFCDYRNKNKSDLWNMSAFGMPVMHSRFRVRMVPYYGDKRLSDRLASPLIVKIIKSGSLFFPLVIKLNYHVGKVGKEEKVNRVWKDAKKSDIQPVNLSKIDEFIDLLKQRNQAKEILQ